MELSKKDRLIIANQLKILEKFYPEESIYYAQYREAVEKGYTLHYECLTEHLYDEMSEYECREVLDILNMYRAMTFSQQKLGESEELTEKSVQFPGFDGNNEAKQHSYTRYLVIDLGLFPELRNGTKFPDFNSHCKMLPTYKDMLNVWNSLSNKTDLAANEIKKILETKSSFFE